MKLDKKRIIPIMHLTEVLGHTDPRTRTTETDKTRELEIENLIRRGTWEMLLDEEVPKRCRHNDRIILRHDQRCKN